MVTAGDGSGGRREMPEILQDVSSSSHVEERWWKSWWWHSSKPVLYLVISDAIDGPCRLALCVVRILKGWPGTCSASVPSFCHVWRPAPFCELLVPQISVVLLPCLTGIFHRKMCFKYLDASASRISREEFWNSVWSLVKGWSNSEVNWRRRKTAVYLSLESWQLKTRLASLVSVLGPRLSFTATITSPYGLKTVFWGFGETCLAVYLTHTSSALIVIELIYPKFSLWLPNPRAPPLLLAPVWALGPGSVLICHYSFSLFLLALLIPHSALESSLRVWIPAPLL